MEFRIGFGIGEFRVCRLYHFYIGQINTEVYVHRLKKPDALAFQKLREVLHPGPNTYLNSKPETFKNATPPKTCLA